MMQYGRVFEKFIGPEEMTPVDALAVLLNRPLRFGDDGQIYSIWLLRYAERLIGFEYECPECEGYGSLKSLSGHCDSCGRECDHCSSMRSRCHDCKGSGRREYTRDEVYRMSERQITVKLEFHELKAAA